MSNGATVEYLIHDLLEQASSFRVIELTSYLKKGRLLKYSALIAYDADILELNSTVKQAADPHYLANYTLSSIQPLTVTSIL
ncbi:hypothetical protein [Pseudoalteromonas sp. MMG005]|uniref:hypothetical protein n=1 Tax=Pseudoalteromonas sp. MMG005 TaxID=2822682 RepID=UPI001B3A020D|nr:hypothetical protein [Pseudoalteromonas sp. MMG005]MBQ4847613.1 hypothetical protein [Pseudoalteromonas sp. MMG005]